MKIRSSKILILITLFFPNLVIAQSVSVQALGPLSVGGELPSFSGMSEKGIELSPTNPKGKFFVYFINETLPPICLDDECGAVGKRIATQGGHLIGGSDGKMAFTFGVKLVSSKPWRFNRSLLVIASARGRILGIYEKATMEEIETIVGRYSRK